MIEMSWDSVVTKDPLLLADAIELTVAFDGENVNRHFSRADFQNYLITESLDDDDSSYLAGDDADERHEQFDQALTLIRNRTRWLGPAYPFRVFNNEVRFTPGNKLRHHLPYLFLLVCSNANNVPTLKYTLPDQFEELCKEALRSLFPEWAEVVSFSQKSEDRKTMFGYSAKDAVPKLAEKLNANLKSTSQLSETQEEFGIDIIAICPFDDLSPFPFFAFAQCTIGQNWPDKRHEAIADSALTGFVDLNAHHSNFLMIPHFPRYKLDCWSRPPHKTGNCILCDRLRICYLLKKSNFLEHERLPCNIARIFNSLQNKLDSVHGSCTPIE